MKVKEVSTKGHTMRPQPLYGGHFWVPLPHMCLGFEAEAGTLLPALQGLVPEPVSLPIFLCMCSHTGFLHTHRYTQHLCSGHMHTPTPILMPSHRCLCPHIGANLTPSSEPSMQILSPHKALQPSGSFHATWKEDHMGSRNAPSPKHL